MKALAIRKLRSAITVGLILWWAGAGCMLVSYAHGAAMSADAGEVSSSGAGWSHAAGSIGTHDCCKARHKSEHRVTTSITDHASSSQTAKELKGIAEVPNSSSAMSCCPLTSGTVVVTGRQRISNEDLSVTQGLDAAPVVQTNFAGTPRALPLRLPNQNQTYLRGCVFLI